MKGEVEYEKSYINVTNNGYGFEQFDRVWQRWGLCQRGKDTKGCLVYRRKRE
jgi:hypothetical protein